MTTLSYSSKLEEVFEFSHIVEDLKSSKKYVKKQLGDVGVNVAMPFVIGIGAVKLKRSKRSLNKSFDILIEQFKTYSERDQMKFERRLIKSFEDLQNKLAPLLNIIESNKRFGSKFFLKEIDDILSLAQERIQSFSDIVYPERIDPASDKDLFNQLIKAYEGVDLTDWREEDRKVS